MKHLQEALNKAGIRDAEGKPLPTTGNFGDMTDVAVRKFQEQKGLEVDGKAGKDTLTALGIYPGQKQAPTTGNVAEKTEEAVRRYQEQATPGQGGNTGKQPSTEPAKTPPGGNFGDRAEETVRKRLEVYQSQTRPLVDYYSQWAATGDAAAPQYRAISGTGTVDEITARAFAALG